MCHFSVYRNIFNKNYSKSKIIICHHFRVRFNWNVQLKKWLNEWMVVNITGDRASVTAVVEVTKTDTDSGTFSSEDDNDEVLSASSTMAGTLSAEDRGENTQNGQQQQVPFKALILFEKRHFHLIFDI